MHLKETYEKVEVVCGPAEGCRSKNLYAAFWMVRRTVQEYIHTSQATTSADMQRPNDKD